jgi:hypothetical protein
MLEAPHWVISLVNDMERLEDVSFERSSSTEAVVDDDDDDDMVENILMRVSESSITHTHHREARGSFLFWR